ncbi:MAG: isopenicillin N synthase family oxygenase, partial [Acidobacteria bacterium]|nr:isopenicillin N synthase family oxygenase [Acidobacteriota bacterium]
MTSLPVVPLDRWLDGSDRDGVAAMVDSALREVGFFLVTGHGIPDDVIAATRHVFAGFFDLPGEQKQAVRMPRLGMAGWAP